MTNTTIAQDTNILILGEKELTAVSQLRKARELAETVKALETEAKAILNEALPEGAHGVDAQGTVVVTRQVAKNGSFDREKLKTAFPEAFEATYRETRYAKLVLAKK